MWFDFFFSSVEKKNFFLLLGQKKVVVELTFKNIFDVVLSDDAI